MLRVNLFFPENWQHFIDDKTIIFIIKYAILCVCVKHCQDTNEFNITKKKTRRLFSDRTFFTIFLLVIRHKVKILETAFLKQEKSFCCYCCVISIKMTKLIRNLFHNIIMFIKYKKTKHYNDNENVWRVTGLLLLKTASYKYP